MFVVGTAGHIDHGKSALVLKMTGIDPDRLPEEKKRGMTIDLGFAWAELPSGRTIGLVDVPGHEKFVKNMVSGVGGIDAVVFVVAADDGWMPQSDEHFEIIRLLQVKTGLVALTKKDLVDEDLLELQADDIREHLKGSFLDGCPVIPVSSVSGEGVNEVKQALDTILTGEIQRPDIGAARLFVDRRFTIQGMGTVVTGTLLEGKLAVDQQVQIQPSGKAARIRKLQTHKTEIPEAVPGSRVAINLAGVEKVEIDRGDAICKAETVVPGDNIAAELTLLGRSKFPLRNGFELSFLLGTADILVKVYLLDRDVLKPGERAPVRLNLRKPVAAKIGDRFIIRRISPQDTIGGGLVLDTEVPAGRKYKNQLLQILQVRHDLSPESIISSELLKKSRIPVSKFQVNIPYSLETLDGALKSMAEKDKVLLSGNEVVSKHSLERYVEPALEIIQADHKMRPWADGIEPGILGKKLKIDPGQLSQVVDFLVSSGEVKSERGALRHPEHKARLRPEQQQLQGKLIARLSAAPLSSPLKKEFIEEDPGYEVVVNFLRDRGEIIELKGGVLFARQDFEKIVEKVKDFISQAKQATASDIKSHLSTSRKYVIPLLERLDQMGVTVRKGDYRILSGR
jgi:selenocysteine-specific elongation factor